MLDVDVDLGRPVLVAGEAVHATVRLAGGGPGLTAVTVRVRVGEAGAEVAAGDGPEEVPVAFTAPEAPGRHLATVVVRAGGAVVAARRRTVLVVPPADPPATRPLVVGEDALDRATAAEAAAALAAGAGVLVLAQPPGAAPLYPVPVTLAPAPTGGRRTTGSGALPSLPRGAALGADDAGLAVEAVVAAVGGRPLPDHPMVLAGDATVVGAHGRLVLCQYRLAGPAAAGDPLAAALLADLVRWAAAPPPAMAVEPGARDDGRRITYYSFPGWA